jgi:hypothetical protein
MPRRRGEQILPMLLREEVTTIYAGMRAATEFSDSQISFHPEERYVCVWCSTRSVRPRTCACLAPARELPDSWLVERAKRDPYLVCPPRARGSARAPPGVGVEQLRVVENAATSSVAFRAVGPVPTNPGQVAARLLGDLHELAGYGVRPDVWVPGTRPTTVTCGFDTHHGSA